MIEIFFNPIISGQKMVYYNRKNAIKFCKNYGYYIRHASFKSNQYIKFEDNKLVWNDGSKVIIKTLPNSKHYGKYSSEIHNLCSF